MFGLLIVVFGLAWLAAGTDLARFSPKGVIAVALMVLGAVTVVTARTDWALSRRSWPLAVGVGLVLALFVSAGSPNFPVGFQHLQFGSQTVAPFSWADVPPVIHGGVGRTEVDLSALTGPPPDGTTLTIDGAAGELVVFLPPDARVIVNAQLAAGQLTVNGVTTGGFKRVENQTLNSDAAGPPLTLVIDSGFGSVEISPAPTNPDPSSSLTTAPPAPLAPPDRPGAP